MNEEECAERRDKGATMSGAPERELELALRKNPDEKQMQVDVGADGSMDATDPPSACQPGGKDLVRSKGFPEIEQEIEPVEQPSDGPKSTAEKARLMLIAQEDAAQHRESEGGYQ